MNICENTLKNKDCFANISATEAPIFMKFYVVVNYYLVSLDFKFHEDLGINVLAQVVIVRARMFYRECAHLRLVRSHFAQIFKKCVTLEFRGPMGPLKF